MDKDNSEYEELVILSEEDTDSSSEDEFILTKLSDL